MSTLDTHLHNCMSGHVGPAELHTTLQAVEVLIQQRQGKVLAGCGVGFWLVDLMENWPQVNSGENTLGHVVELLTQAISILLSCCTGTMVVMVTTTSATHMQNGGQRTQWHWLIDSACCFTTLHIHSLHSSRQR